MSVQVKNLEKNMVKLTIEVSAEELEKALQAAYMKEKSKISIPGFRKGKVPRMMVEKMYGPEIFFEDAANMLITQEYPKAVEESGADVVSRPEIDVTQIEKGKPFIFTAEVAVRPEVTLGEYKGVTVTKVSNTVTEEELNEEIDRERKSNARTITVEDRAIAEGDTAVIDFEGFTDGVAFEGGKGENHSLVIGSHSFIPGFEEQLIGKNAGDEFDVNVTFPEEYHAQELAGKPAIFKVKVNEVKAEELPELDDEFAQDVSEFDTLAEYKESVEQKLVERNSIAYGRSAFARECNCLLYRNGRCSRQDRNKRFNRRTSADFSYLGAPNIPQIQNCLRIHICRSSCHIGGIGAKIHPPTNVRDTCLLIYGHTLRIRQEKRRMTFCVHSRFEPDRRNHFSHKPPTTHDRMTHKSSRFIKSGFAISYSAFSA